MENLERNYSYRIIFLFLWYVSIRTGQNMPGSGDFVSFFRPGGRRFALKSCPRGGLLTKRVRVRVNYRLNISNLLQMPVCVSLLFFIFIAFMTLYNPSQDKKTIRKLNTWTNKAFDLLLTEENDTDPYTWCLVTWFLRRCLSRKGWDQNTSYHQLTTWANGTNQPCAGLDQNETRVMFLSSLGSSIMANQE